MRMENLSKQVIFCVFCSTWLTDSDGGHFYVFFFVMTREQKKKKKKETTASTNEKTNKITIVDFVFHLEL